MIIDILIVASADEKLYEYIYNTLARIDLDGQTCHHALRCPRMKKTITRLIWREEEHSLEGLIQRAHWI